MAIIQHSAALTILTTSLLISSSTATSSWTNWMSWSYGVDRDGATTREHSAVAEEKKKRELIVSNNDVDASSSATSMEFATILSDEELLATFLTSPPPPPNIASDGTSSNASSSSSSSKQLPIEIRSAETATNECITKYINGHTITPLLEKPILYDDGIILSTGNPYHFVTSPTTADGGGGGEVDNNWGNVKSTNNNSPGDAQLMDLLGGNVNTYDACYIEFEFICLSPPSSSSSSSSSNNTKKGQAKVSFSYNFASEEYYEASTEYTDAFAFFLNGENIALIPSNEEEKEWAGIQTINQNINSELFIGNDINGIDGVQYPLIEADGLTVQLIASGTVDVSDVSDEENGLDKEEEIWNTIKIVIADVGDNMLDSWLLLNAHSFRCEMIDDDVNQEVSDMLFQSNVTIILSTNYTHNTSNHDIYNNIITQPSSTISSTQEVSTTMSYSSIQQEEEQAITAAIEYAQTSAAASSTPASMIYIACGASSTGCSGQTQVAQTFEQHEVRCCSEVYLGSGWKRHVNCANAGYNVWGESEINGVCKNAATYDEAHDLCLEMNSRLCTKEELLADCTRGTGCGHDADMIWSSTPSCQGMTVQVDVNTDRYPQETAWTISNVCNGVNVEFSPDYTSQFTSYSNEYCLSPDARYKFRITDSYGDGICCSGKYKVCIVVNAILVNFGVLMICLLYLVFDCSCLIAISSRIH